MRAHVVNYRNVKEKVAKAKGNDVTIHFKQAREIAGVLRHMKLKRAKQFLCHVIQHKEAVPFRRYKYGIGHNPQGKAWKWSQSGFPVKASRVFLELIRNCESNAKKNNLNVRNCAIAHIKVNKARIHSRRMYRAHGRINRFNKTPCHIEMIMTEKGISVQRAARRARKEAKKE
ncbi:putative 60S ribosomal protein L17-2 [Monocercomonoides exilis]|uniref:putative 60S ribosomal protein L17-2 n=1 Tax=Monocercomonoides exilis TaxID=2049356 RepID=UPI003559C26B|nr:putative 60S ribosomal protein L17-2 [Monocercomonoides exilis]KAH7821871.1 putative 60S ribosomal protein L17-2 [Monocercomonoides exilis]KAH7825354.1 putative 60S ribosomal protein L17-2 [Monocercomonoides exilis]|eukprot:MONOS_559.1-p1 / transcript=MONOS_559.1 / gene=MONOS_559 / organism=Monocercomonoides_exilis_PA203 / gene_product=60S ribosomal protein L17-2 / transcript_product=60S ribosomal protein L17-2 / location=Mono_scaffold00009:41644-42444(+) / protein_length=173 / sequence_SO=supercontig / SO=protein_coding / is_pseudo=false